MMSLEGLGRTDRNLMLRFYPGNRLEGLRKTKKIISQDNRSPGRDLNPGPPEYEAGMLTTRPRSSTKMLCTAHIRCLLFVYYTVPRNNLYTPELENISFYFILQN
jgi:hypothetical protein